MFYEYSKKGVVVFKQAKRDLKPKENIQTTEIYQQQSDYVTYITYVRIILTDNTVWCPTTALVH